VQERVRALRIRPFRRLLTSYTVNELGDSAGVVALAILVFDRTGNVASTAALFLAAKFIPAVVAPLLTAKLDQLATRRTLPLIYLAEATVFGALALIADGNFLLVAVLVLAVVDGTLAVTARGLTRAAIANTLQPTGLLREGNALVNIGFAAAAVVGAAVAGVLIATVGLSATLLLDAVSFLLIAGLLAVSSDLPNAGGEREPWLARIRSGLTFVRHHQTIRWLLLGEAIALVLFTMIIPIEVVYAKETLGSTSAGFGILLASWGLGIVIGSLIYVFVKERSPRLLILISTAVIGAAYLGMAGAQTLTVACLLSVLGGAGNGVQWVAVITAIQEATPADYQARVVGLLESSYAAMPGIGYVLGAAITAVGSPRTAYAVAGGGILLLVLGASVAVFAIRGDPGRQQVAPSDDSPLPMPTETDAVAPTPFGSGSGSL
jgi:predicted MFS family arabinose efflux permease